VDGRPPLAHPIRSAIRLPVRLCPHRRLFVHLVPVVRVVGELLEVRREHLVDELIERDGPAPVLVVPVEKDALLRLWHVQLVRCENLFELVEVDLAALVGVEAAERTEQTLFGWWEKEAETGEMGEER
jgi:hypothetical protein